MTDSAQTSQKQTFRVSFMGAGKLGLPVALAVEDKGHSVMVYDINPKVHEIIETKKLTYKEEGAQELLNKSKIRVAGSVREIVEHGEIIFVPIQTPHNPRFEGTTRLPSERVDFDYSYLINGIKMLSEEIEKQGKDKIVIIISTVLPGTIEHEIKPLLSKHLKLCYNPFFIAMGTTIPDFLNPEIVLFGVDDPEAVATAEMFYRTIHNRPFFKTTIRNAEGIKVLYNTNITLKTVYGNLVMELAHKLGMDSDVIIDALSRCNDRIISPRYLRGGMGDAGGCHPRDNIALSWLARKHNLSFDLFEAAMLARENQTEWLANLMIEQLAHHPKLPMVILGTAYKPETNLTIGSCSILLKNLLEGKGFTVKTYDPHVDGEKVPTFAKKPAIYLVGTKHPEFQSFAFPTGSVVLDPFRYIPERKGVHLIPIGKPKEPQADKILVGNNKLA